ncbi:MAG: lipoyl(octanoyl) transferase LipB [Myxococcales bacterium]|nr:lipoyl(octanoyl) transferase LipB [Myxococcales bacterium]
MASTPEPAGPLVAVWLGRQPFAETLGRQLAARDALAAGEGPPTLFLVEHPPTLTLGRRASRADILWSDEELEAASMAVCETPRGGQVTLHAPGQLVAYPVVHVGRRIRDHIVTIAEVARLLLAELGVEGPEFRMDHPGLWLGERKIASIGIHVSRGITVQGIAINLDVEPTLFASLVSCGLPGVEVTSAAKLGAPALPSMAEAARRYAELFAELRGFELSWGEGGAPG